MPSNECIFIKTFVTTKKRKKLTEVKNILKQISSPLNALGQFLEQSDGIEIAIWGFPSFLKIKFCSFISRSILAFHSSLHVVGKFTVVVSAMMIPKATHSIESSWRS